MSESQNTEYRESWDDACLRWLCGFANARGGVMYIGLDDSMELPELTVPKILLKRLRQRSRTNSVLRLMLR